MVPDTIVRATVEQFSAGAMIGGRDRADLHFEALKRMLDRNQSDYRN